MKPNDIYILIGCEESQAICMAFRALGFQAFSCDLKPCSGGHPEYHIQGDVLNAITGGWITLQNGERVYITRWHGAMLHPVCKYMAVSGLFRNINNPERAAQTELSLQFVCKMLNLCILMKIPNIGIENPVSCISTRIYRNVFGKYEVIPLSLKHAKYPNVFKPTQTIQPYEFYEDASKRTCLWLIGWPKLKKGKRFPGRWVDGKERWSNQTDSGQNRLAPSEKRDEVRSKTYPNIAQAIAQQWGNHLLTTLLY
jgi:hypothetical protein